jgi:hypothetical protein
MTFCSIFSFFACFLLAHSDRLKDAARIVFFFLLSVFTSCFPCVCDCLVRRYRRVWALGILFSQAAKKKKTFGFLQSFFFVFV